MIIKEEYLNINIIYDYLADEEKNLYQKLSQSINEYKADSTTIEQMLNETINNLRIINIEKRIKENDVNTKQASEAGNLVLLSHYMEERQYLLNERAKLNKLKYHMNGD